MGMTYLNPQLDSFTTTQLGNMYEMFLTFAYGTFAVAVFLAVGLIAASAFDSVRDRSSSAEG